MLYANRLNSFWVIKENVAIWQKYSFCHPIGQKDLSCPRTIRSEICWKCRETIPLVQVCFRFGYLYYLLRFWSYCKKSEPTREILTKFSLFLAFFSPRDGVGRILKLSDYSNYTRIHNSWKFGENRSVSFWERTVNKKNKIKIKINRSRT